MIAGKSGSELPNFGSKGIIDGHIIWTSVGRKLLPNQFITNMMRAMGFDVYQARLKNSQWEVNLTYSLQEDMWKTTSSLLQSGPHPVE